MDYKTEFLEIANVYLNDDVDYKKLTAITERYKQLLQSICDQEWDTDEGRRDLHFDNGKALGTYWAALCLDDISRTRQFMRGIDLAIRDQYQSKDSLHILYAGTGPFATLMLPLMYVHAEKNIRFTLMEINPISFNALSHLLSQLELLSDTVQLVNEDATQYKIDPTDQPDIIVSETMQNALAKEQQVPIFINLMQQASLNTVFIPEKIEVFIGLKEANVNLLSLKPNHYHKFKSVVTISKEAVFPTPTSENQAKDPFEIKKTTLDRSDYGGFIQLVFITEIQVYREIYLSINDSGLTTPLPMYNIPEDAFSPITVQTQYTISSEPKLEYTLLSKG